MSGGARSENGRDIKTWRLGSKNQKLGRGVFHFFRVAEPDEGAMELTTRCTDQANESATTSGSRLSGVIELLRNSDHTRAGSSVFLNSEPHCWIENMTEEGLAQTTAMTNGIGTNAAVF
jgi:hypothetical protein